MHEGEVYYIIYKTNLLSSASGKLKVICIQYFNNDEIEQELNRFLKDKEGNILKFKDETKAIQWLLDNIKEELIDPFYLEEKILDDIKYYK